MIEPFLHQRVETTCGTNVGHAWLQGSGVTAATRLETPSGPGLLLGALATYRSPNRAAADAVAAERAQTRCYRTPRRL